MSRTLFQPFLFALAWAVVFIFAPALLHAEEPDRPTPDVADFAYGNESERQRFDLWLAKSDRPTPLVLLIHGGGWMRGDKSSYGRGQIEPLLEAGISVAAVNYRFITQAMEQGVKPPVRACVYDAARALQTLRAKAADWNLDPTRVGATGSSAGACTSLWLALHDDLATPGSDDAVARQSSRLTCAAVNGAQTTLDPQLLRRWMPNAVYGGHAFGFAAPKRDRAGEFEELLKHRDALLDQIREYSPLDLVSADDPPIFLEFPRQARPPVEGQPEDDPTHSAMYGVKLKEKLDAVGVEAVLSYPGHTEETYRSIQGFLINILGRR